MRGVEARRCGKTFKSSQDFCNFFEARADGDSHPCRILDKDAQIAERNSLGTLLHGFDDRGDGLLWRGFPARAGMNDQKISAEGYAANEFIVERLDGAHSQHRLSGGEVDQIVRVNNKRTQTQFRAAGSKGGGVYFRDAGRAGLPHARACGENLQRVAAQIASGFKRVEVAARDGSVDADTQAAVHPCGWKRLRLGFGAVLVLVIELGDVSERLLWRSHGENQPVLKQTILSHAAKRLREAGRRAGEEKTPKGEVRSCL